MQGRRGAGAERGVVRSSHAALVGVNVVIALAAAGFAWDRLGPSGGAPAGGDVVTVGDPAGAAAPATGRGARTERGSREPPPPPAPIRSADPGAATGAAPAAAPDEALAVLVRGLEAVRGARGCVPTSDREFGANRGIEAVVAALASVGAAGALRLGDADGDGRLEAHDPWGRPFLYVSGDDAGAPQSWTPGDAAAVEVAADAYLPGGATPLAGGFLLLSAGPDGRLDATGDDLSFRGGD